MPNEPEKVRERLALRAATTYMLRSARVLNRIVGNGDILRTLIFLAIVDANVRHLRPGEVFAQTHSGADDRVPDEARRPISIHALALELDLPYETTRRHVNRLINDGMCERWDSGVIVPGEVLGRETFVVGLKQNYENLRQLLDDLKTGGVSFDD